MRRTALNLLSGLCCVSISVPVVMAQSVPPIDRAKPASYAGWLTEAAARFALPVTWIRAIMHAESAGKEQVTSPKGAMGLMQIMPATWAFLHDQLRLGDDPYDPHDNIIAGAAYMRMLFDRYGSPGWIAAYNAGPGRYDASLTGRALPTETRAYLKAVATYVQRDGDSSPVILAPKIPLVWTHAPLFIVSPMRNPTAVLVVSAPVPVPVNTAPHEREVSFVTARSDGLFVAQSTIGTAP